MLAIRGLLEGPAGTPLTGQRAYRVRFYDAATAGNILGLEFTGTVEVSDTGRFTIELTPDDAVLNASQVWYELAIDSSATPDGRVDVPADVFTERSKLYSVPFALRSESGGQSGDSLWSSSGEDVFRPSGFVGIGTSSPQSALDVRGDTQVTGTSSINNITGEARVQSFVGSIPNGLVLTQGSNGTDNVVLDSLAGFPSRGWLGVIDELNFTAARVYVGAVPNGVVDTIGPEGSDNAALDSLSGFPDHGWMGVMDAEGNASVAAFCDENSQGYLSVINNEGTESVAIQALETREGSLELRGPNGEDNVRLSANEENRNHGFMAVANSDGNSRARMFVDSDGHGSISVDNSSGSQRAGILIDGDGLGIVYGDQKTFVADYPGKPDFRIVYTSLEGPEPAIYCRGTVNLEDGRGTIELPDHFTALSSPGTLSIQLTPASLESRGVAFEIDGNGSITVGELNGGTGSYPVHYVAYALRAGFEDYEPVVQKDRSKLSSISEVRGVDTISKQPARSNRGAGARAN